MIDYQDSNELLALSEDLKTMAHNLQLSLADLAKSKGRLDILIAERIDSLLERKKNIGMDMAVILMISKEPELAKDYCEKLRLEAEVKGLEASKEALESQIMLVMALLKHQVKQGG